MVNDEPLPPWEDDSEEYFLNFAFPGQKITPGSVNGRKFEYPGVNSLFQSNQVFSPIILHFVGDIRKIPVTN